MLFCHHWHIIIVQLLYQMMHHILERDPTFCQWLFANDRCEQHWLITSSELRMHHMYPPSYQMVFQTDIPLCCHSSKALEAFKSQFDLVVSCCCPPLIVWDNCCLMSQTHARFTVLLTRFSQAWPSCLLYMGTHCCTRTQITDILHTRACKYVTYSIIFDYVDPETHSWRGHS